MGCAASGQLYEDRLEKAERDGKRQAWRQQEKAGDLRTLECLVVELQELHDHYSLDNKAGAKLERVLALGNSVAAELERLMDKALLVRGDVLMVEKILHIARNLDRVKTMGALAGVEAKHKALQEQMGRDRLREVNNALQAMAMPDDLVPGAKQVLSLLQQADICVAKVPELAPLMLQCGTAFVVKVLELVKTVLDSDPKSVQTLYSISENLDRMCTSLARSIGENWVPLVPKMKEALAAQANESVLEKLDALEAELAKPSGMSRRTLLQLLDELASLWTWFTSKAELQGRLDEMLDTVEGRVTDVFDKAVEAGEANKIDRLLAFAKDFDLVRYKFTSSRDLPPGQAPKTRSLEKALESKRTTVTLNELLSNAKNQVAEHSKALKMSFKEAKDRIKRIPRDKFEDLAGQPQWKFGLNGGGSKPYDPTKSVEVERHYRDWLSKGEPANVEQRRYEISIEVDTSAMRRSGSRSDVPNNTAVPRPRCRYGATCRRQNPAHQRDFCHPTDWDWDEAGTSSRRIDTYSLDFLLMTQVNLSQKGAMRKIIRIEGMTFAQKHTHEYFAQVKDFVAEAANKFTEAEREMHILGEKERKQTEQQVDELLRAMKPAVHEFMELAVEVEAMKDIDDVIADLGTHAEQLKISASLKDMRLNSVLHDLKQAYADEKLRDMQGMPRRWALVRRLWQKKAMVLRYSLEQTKEEHRILQRRQMQMRCQALLSEYEEDEEFIKQFRSKTAGVLEDALRRAAERQQIEVVQSIVLVAASWKLDTQPFVAPAGAMISTAIKHSCTLVRIGEVLDAGHMIAKATQRPPTTSHPGGGVPTPRKSFEQDFSRLYPHIAGRALLEVELFVKDTGPKAEPKAAADSERMSKSLQQVADLRTRLKLYNDHAVAGFDNAFWDHFQQWYEQELAAEFSVSAIEWAIAITQKPQAQAMTLPQWMMNKDQVEALRKLKHALNSGDEKELRAAVMFAKQGDFKGDAAFSQMIQNCIERLATMKRLPPGWDLNPVVDQPFMFQKVDNESKELKDLFQKLFNETQASIVTRDRATRTSGSMPRGYRVQRIEQVMNADSWSSYMTRRDKIIEQCKRIGGSAPCADAVWAGWSGKIQTLNAGKEILASTKQLELSAHANEFLLLHGTKPEAAEFIAKNHFDMAFACKTGLFGAGLYFAESSSKCDEYVKPNIHDQFPAVVCRVTLGRINYCPNKDPVTDPGREKLEGSCIRGEYHSVIGDRKKAKGTYREFIVYDHYQVYPHFIVWYTRL